MNVNKLKFKFLVTVSFFFGINNAIALENEVKMGGIYDVQSIYYKNNGKREQRIVSINSKEFALNTSGNIFVDYRLISDDNDIYGAKISFEHTTYNDRAVPLYLYYESEYGRWEGGADSSAGKKMRITGYTSSCGLGNGWNSIIKPSPNVVTSSDKLTAYITNFCSFLDSKTRTAVKSDYSRKITYFTPKLPLSKDHQLQFGVSYIPDSSNMGHDDVDADKKNAAVPLVPYNFAIKDGISYGGAYKGKFSDELSAKVSFVGEFGKVLAFNKKDDTKSDIKFKDLNTYVVGGELKYNDISISAAYTNYNKSLTAKSVDKISRDSYAYGFGVKYNLDKYIFSINQFNSSFKKNKLYATSLGAEYLVAKGFKTYAQTTLYRNDGKYLDTSNVVKSNKGRGFLAFLGMKISF
jgi:hypothetical protein